MAYALRRGNMWSKKLSILTVLLLIVCIGLVMYSLRKTETNSQTIKLHPAISQASSSTGTYKMYSRTSGEAYDRLYINEMIVLQQEILAMAELAAQKATKPELRELALKSKSSAENTVASLSQWQTEWQTTAGFDDEYDGHESHEAEEEALGDVMQLEAQSGETFDRLYLKHAIEQYAVAVDMSLPGKTNASHKDLKKFTIDAAASFKAVHSQLKKLLQESSEQDSVR